LLRSCLLKYVIVGKIEGMGRERKCKQILDGLQEMRGYWILKEEALGCTLWGTYCKTDYIRMMHPYIICSTDPKFRVIIEHEISHKNTHFTTYIVTYSIGRSPS